MKKLKYLIKYGLKKRIKSKAFLIANAVMGVAIIGIMLAPLIISFFQKEAEQIIVSDKIVIVNTTGYDEADKDFSNYISAYINSYLTGLNMIDDIRYDILTEEKDVPSNNYYDEIHDENGLIYIYRELISNDLNEEDPNNYIIQAKIYNLSIDSSIIQASRGALKEINRFKYMIDNNVDSSLIVDLIPEFVENPNIIIEDNSSMLGALAPMFVVPIFVLITFAVQAIGIEIIDEKSSKAIEIIIASVKPTTHFVAKILSIIIFQVIQMSLFVVFALVGLGLNAILSGVTHTGAESWSSIIGEYSNMLLPVVTLVILCAILGATIYAILGAFIASISLNQEDYQQTQTPVMLLMTIAYLGSMFAGIFDSSVLLYIFTYIPFLAPLSIPITFLMGYITGIEAIIGIVVLMLSVGVLALLIAPLYKASILSYDQSKLFKRVKNAFKNAKALKENELLYEGNNTDANK